MKKSPSIMVSAVVAVLMIAGCSGPTSAESSSSQSIGRSSAAAGDVPAVAPAGSAPGVGSADAVAPAANGVAAADAAAPAPAVGQANRVTVAPAAVIAAADPTKRLITAQGVGTVTGTPDVLTITLGVQTNSGSAQTAMSENNRLATDTIAVIKASGVADADLQTSQLTVSPTYDDKYTITGYQVSNMVTAKLRNIDGAGALIDAVGKAAGDAVRVQQLSFSIDDESDLRAAARAAAVQQAQAQAKQLAEAAGVALGPVDSITESAGSSPLTYAAPMAADASAGAPIQAGSQELSIVVQVVYQIG
jgi:uncharacterized protein YggE